MGADGAWVRGRGGAEGDVGWDRIGQVVRIVSHGGRGRNRVVKTYRAILINLTIPESATLTTLGHCQG